MAFATRSSGKVGGDEERSLLEYAEALQGQITPYSLQLLENACRALQAIDA
jgi:hypothetical protein